MRPPVPSPKESPGGQQLCVKLFPLKVDSQMFHKYKSTLFLLNNFWATFIICLSQYIYIYRERERERDYWNMAKRAKTYVSPKSRTTPSFNPKGGLEQDPGGECFAPFTYHLDYVLLVH